VLVLPTHSLISQASTGSSVIVVGTVVESIGGKQEIEIRASKAEVLSSCDDKYPLAKKKHTHEHLRKYAHLRSRTNLVRLF
jgi:asparaginyl-tRNA synthetase